MKSKNRAAAFGMAGALAVGTFASVGAISPAGAATNNYACEVPFLGTKSFPVTASSPFPNEVLPGAVLTDAATSLGVGLDKDTVNAIVGILMVTSVAGTVADTALSVGDQSLPLTGLTIASTALPTNGTSGVTLPVSGTTEGFTAPTTLGSYPVKLPPSFIFTPVNSGGGAPIVGDIPCALPPTGTGRIGTMKVVSKYSSTTAAKLRNAPITRAKHAKILAKVVNGNGAAGAGKVIAKEGTKTLAKGTLSSAGKKTLVLPLLKKGIHKIFVKYSGNATTQASKKVVKFTVR